MFFFIKLSLFVFSGTEVARRKDLLLYGDSGGVAVGDTFEVPVCVIWCTVTCVCVSWIVLLEKPLSGPSAGRLGLVVWYIVCLYYL